MPGGSWGSRWLTRAAIAAVLVLVACSPNDPPGGKGRLSIATGGSGGVYQVLGGGLADLITDELPDAPTTAETTSASVDNLVLVAEGESVAAMRDGSIDAFFWSGGVPTGAVTDLATTDDIRPLDLTRHLPELRRRHGEAYVAAETDEGDYASVPAVQTIGVPNVLVVNAAMSEDLAYRITRLLFDGHARLAQVHPSAEKMGLETARRVVAPVRLHPGASRYYAEVAR